MHCLYQWGMVEGPDWEERPRSVVFSKRPSLAAFLTIQIFPSTHKHRRSFRLAFSSSCQWPPSNIRVCAQSLSCVQRFVTPWTAARQAPLSMEFSTQKYWSGLSFSSPGDLPKPEIEPSSPALQSDRFFTVWATREAPFSSRATQSSQCKSHCLSGMFWWAIILYVFSKFQTLIIVLGTIFWNYMWPHVMR